MYLESENTKFIRLQPSKKGKAHFFFAFLKNYCLSVFYALFYSPFFGAARSLRSGRAIAQLASLLGPAALRALVCRLWRPCSSPSACGPLGLQDAKSGIRRCAPHALIGPRPPAPLRDSLKEPLGAAGPFWSKQAAKPPAGRRPERPQQGL